MKKYLTLPLLATVGLMLTACGTGTSSGEAGSNSDEPTDISIGVVGDISAEIWNDVSDRLVDQGINLEVVTFSDYVQPNRALEDGELDLNAFQHVAFLSEYVADLGGDSQIVPVGYSIISPVFIFTAEGIDTAEDIPEGATVAVPNAATVAERAFLSLENVGLITLDEEAGFAPTVDDIEEYNKDIEIIEMESNQLARALGDAEAIVIGGDMVADAGLDPAEAVYSDADNLENIDPLKKNVIATQKDNVDSEAINAVVEEYQSEETRTLMNEISNGTMAPAWGEEDTALEDFEQALEDLNIE